MWKKLMIPGAVGAFAATLLIRAAKFKPTVEQAAASSEVKIDRLAAANHLGRMVQCKTVSSRDESLVDKAEFERFLNLLEELYPNIHSSCTVERIGPSGILFALKGKSSLAPTLLMSHYDVVPAEEEKWERPAFSGLVAYVDSQIGNFSCGDTEAFPGSENRIKESSSDGFVWGRGTLDTKGTLCGIMEAAEALLIQGFVPENDLYFAFSGDEETRGETAPIMAEALKKRGIRLAMVLDEGGAIVAGAFPGVSRPAAFIGMAEKGALDVELSVESQGGHASAPPRHTPVGVLSEAVTRIEKHPFPMRLTPPVKGMFDTLGRHSSFGYRILFANLWCFQPLLFLFYKSRGGELPAMLKTTCAFTMMEGSKAENVLPPLAKMTANLRIIDGETVDSAVARLQALANNPEIKFRVISGTNPSPNSKIDDAKWRVLKNAIHQTWPEAIISPYLMYVATDSRYYHSICDHVYRFSAMELSKEERALIHGNNERIPLETLTKIVQFYHRLMRQL